MLKRLKFKSEFSRNILTLMTGTTVAQAIPIAISPILTRIFEPTEFGILALFVSITSIIAVIATLRYELAIVQPHSDKDAVAIVVLSVGITSIVTLFSLIIIHIFNGDLQSWLGNVEIGLWLYLVPLSVFITGTYRSLSYWNTRKKLFKSVAISKVNQSVGTAAVQVSFGLSGIGSVGLIWGYLLGYLIALLTLIKKSLIDDKKMFINVKYENIKRNAIAYKKMPKYSTFGALADSISLQMPILVISKFYDLMQTGIFSLVFRVLNLPLSFVSVALSQVLLQKIARMHHESPKQIKLIILKLFFLLLAMMIPFISLIWMCGEDLFAFVFGEAWREAGEMAAVLVFAVAIRFATSPLSVVMALDHNVKLGALWQFTYFLTITFTLFYFSSFDIKVLLFAFVAHEILLYTLYLFIILKGSASKRAN